MLDCAEFDRHGAKIMHSILQPMQHGSLVTKRPTDRDPEPVEHLGCIDFLDDRRIVIGTVAEHLAQIVV